MSAPELFHQRAYLARVVSLDASAGPRDEGIVPLAAFVDGTGSDGDGDAIAVTLEADGSGAIYPVVYARRGGRLEEADVRPGSAPALRHAGGPGAAGGPRRARSSRAVRLVSRRRLLATS